MLSRVQTSTNAQQFPLDECAQQIPCQFSYYFYVCHGYNYIISFAEVIIFTQFQPYQTRKIIKKLLKRCQTILKVLNLY